MPKRSSKPDENEMAFDSLQELLRRDEARDKGEPIDLPVEDDQSKKNPAAVALGRLGGLKGGKARADALTDEERSAAARKAVQASWNRQTPLDHVGVVCVGI